MRKRRQAVAVSVALLLASTLSAQTAAKQAPDEPSYKVGATIFTDYTWQESPASVDAAGHEFHASSFNVSRAYLNLTGNLNHRIAFRITPDVTRESGAGSSLSGSQTFRLKYAFAQLNLDDWTTKGSWVRLGVQQTPLIDYSDTIYRYRFQGAGLEDREGYLASSDAGLSMHWNFPADYGDVHAGYYNGEGYNKAETNDQKAFQLRASVRPFPAGGALKGLRLTGFTTLDHYVSDGEKERMVAQVTYEHPRVNAGADFLQAKDRTSAVAPMVKAEGYSVWATPKLPHHFELLLRHDELKPNTDTDQKRKRNIAGVAYWVPDLNKVTAALMLDYDSLQQSGYAQARPDDTRYGLKLLINF